jgi:DnaJ like chaperone protein
VAHQNQVGEEFMARTGWTGKWTGAILGGFVGSALIPKIGFLLGAAIGAIWGHQYDLSRAGTGKGFRGFSRISSAERQQIFFESVFLAMGRLAKADGRVSEEEIQVARSFMHQWGLSPEDVRVAIALFSRGKEADFPIDQQMQKLAAACQGQPELLHAFVEVLMEIPLSKGGIDPAERELLWRMASGIGFSRVQMAQLEAILRAQRSFGQGAGAGTGSAASAQAQLQEAYKALGIDSSATDKEVKTAYRRLMNQHHPDKLASKGLPESMLEVAKERTREIRSAYELLRDHRGIR